MYFRVNTEQPSSPSVSWHPLPLVLSSGQWAGVRFHVCFLCGFYVTCDRARGPMSVPLPPGPCACLSLVSFFKVRAPVAGNTPL